MVTGVDRPAGTVAVTYTAPGSRPTGGMDVITAQNGPVSPTVTVTDTYSFNPSRITLRVFDIDGVEGNEISETVASFRDRDPDARPEDYMVTIDWGDGKSSAGTVSEDENDTFWVDGTHTYAEEGTYVLVVTVRGLGATATGRGTARILDAPLSAEGVDLDLTEGEAFRGAVATFFDDNPGASAAEFRAQIVWGDGQSSAGVIQATSEGGFDVVGSHTYAEEGNYTIRVTIQDRGGSTASVTATATVDDADISVTALDVAATQGVPFSGVVATFIDDNPNPPLSDFTATIDWGDETTSPGSISRAGNHFEVRGSHTYVEDGDHTIGVTVRDRGGASDTNFSTATVSPLIAQGLKVKATEGIGFSGPVATFRHAGRPDADAADFTATISWGDGGTSNGTIVAAGRGNFEVRGSHTYAEEGNYRIRVTISDEEENSVTVRTSAEVADAPLAAAGKDVSAVEGRALTDVLVATLTDANPRPDIKDFRAAIQWGDGTSSAGAIAANRAGGFDVRGSHTYARRGTRTGTVRIRDIGGSTASATFTARVRGRPVVTGISPTSGPALGGTAVTITGVGFDRASAVRFGESASTSFVVNSDSKITARAPAHLAGVVDVTVTTDLGTSAIVAADRFSYLPTVESIRPDRDSTTGGLIATILGSGFRGTSAVLFFDLVRRTFLSGVFKVDSDRSITVTTPRLGAGPALVYVTSGGVTSTTAAVLTVFPRPEVAVVTPPTGSTAGGTRVTILGTGFKVNALTGTTIASRVTFGGVPALFTVESEGKITATAPGHVAGEVDVQVTTAGGTSAPNARARFTYRPVVTAISPSRGPAGRDTPVVITGRGFSTATAVLWVNGRTKVETLARFRIDSDTQITSVAPGSVVGRDLGAAAAVYVRAGGVLAPEPVIFNYFPQPSVAQISPATGPTSGGTVVTILGGGFRAETGAGKAVVSKVMFGDTAATRFNVKSDGEIAATAPAHAAGEVNVQVTTEGGASDPSRGSRFTYTRPDLVSIARVTPA